MLLHDAQFQYVEGQARPTFPALLADFDALGTTAVEAGKCMLDVRYGSGARQRFDFFPACGEPAGTLLYFHAGYWQSRDKATFRFIAPAFARRGLNVALLNYPLCPTVSLAELVAAARESVPEVLAHVAVSGQPARPLIVAGHSAGGHLAVELALSRWPALGARAQAVDGVIALSGVFDLEPLVGTSLNAKLGLDRTLATRHSPIHRVAAGGAPALFAVGGNETPAFLDQNRRMHDAWQAAGNEALIDVVPGADHFSVLRQFVAPDSELSGKVTNLLQQAQQRFGRSLSE